MGRRGRHTDLEVQREEEEEEEEGDEGEEEGRHGLALALKARHQ